jgi:GNAT superfamily N-acetyltransferase
MGALMTFMDGENLCTSIRQEMLESGMMKLAAAEGSDPPTGETEPIVIEEATEADHHAVRAVLIMAYAEHQAALPPAVFSAYIADLMDLESRAGVSQLLIARRGGRAVGTVTYYPDARLQGVGWPDEGWAAVRGLGVVPQARQQGVARWLIGACLARARAAQAPVLGLHVADFTQPAINLYRKLGFRPAPHFDFTVPPVTARAYLRLNP